MIHRFLLVTYTVLIMVCVASPAYAYVDPGSGLLLMQGLLAAFGALLVFIKSPVKFLKNYLNRIFRRK